MLVFTSALFTNARMRSCCLHIGLSPVQEGTELMANNSRHIVGFYMLRPFAHPVACCWIVLGVVGQSLKPVKRANSVGSCTLRPFAHSLLSDFRFSVVNESDRTQDELVSVPAKLKGMY